MWRLSWRGSSRRVGFRGGSGTGGTIGSVPGFSSLRSAEAYAGDMDSDQRRQVWIDPAGGRLVPRSWVERWLPVQDLDPRTVLKASRSPYPKGLRPKSAATGRSRTAPSAKRTRSVPAAPIAAGERDQVGGSARERRRHGASGTVSGTASETPQQGHRCAERSGVTRDQPRTARNPSGASRKA